LLRKQLREKEEQRLQDLVSCKGILKLQFWKKGKFMFYDNIFNDFTEAATRTERCTG
jgi:hypothetical protein